MKKVILALAMIGAMIASVANAEVGGNVTQSGYVTGFGEFTQQTQSAFFAGPAAQFTDMMSHASAFFGNAANSEGANINLGWGGLNVGSYSVSNAESYCFGGATAGGTVSTDTYMGPIAIGTFNATAVQTSGNGDANSSSQSYVNIW